MAGTYEMMAAFVDELAARGLAHVCISPGSRSTPLALTFARHPAIRHWVHHDERSSAFFALGAAKTIGTPVAVVTTSGTAAAEPFPAVVEARFGRVPLLILTADRPPSLRYTGANQTIDQVELFGTNVKWFLDAPPAAVLEPGDARTIAARAWARATAAPAGPVHINFPFEEPLVPAGGDPVFRADRAAVPSEPHTPAPDGGDLEEVARLVEGTRGVLIAGPQPEAALAPALARLAEATGFPIFADPLSGVRAGPHDVSRVVGHYDALAQAGFLDRQPPEAVIRFGAVPTSKALNTWLASNPATAYAVVDVTGWPDPGNTARTVLTAGPAAAASGLAALIDGPVGADWCRSWLDADATAAASLPEPAGPFTELGAVAAVVESVPSVATLWVASSMPIRQVDLLMGSSSRAVRFLANRGASGIDGFLASGIGSAVVGESPTYLIAGDLSTLHDLTSLAWAGRSALDVTIVVVNNDGGGIFHLLPQAPLPEFEELFGTPHGLDFRRAADLFGFAYVRVEDAGPLAEAVSRSPDGPLLVEARFERSAGARAYRAATERVRRALAGRE